MNIGVIGIHTGIGKTLVSAILCEALGADYWKPIQAGELDNSDSLFISKNVQNTQTKVHKEKFQFKAALSPHTAANMENVSVSLNDLQLPETKNSIIIETAGGLHSPVNDNKTMLDLVIHLNTPVIVVSQNYLGSINHTLLTIEALKNSGVFILGLIFNGVENESSEKFILENSGIACIGRIPFAEKPDKVFINNCAKDLSAELKKISHEFI
ncbi:MAG TPA: dethiobiotin synthase [Bacteroidia bacterium]|nr:dethiobiotin synthase [Bacteroidia bacterium]HNS11180.1 dethiobiotin synthase [Bacteroidia bacterium]